MSLPARALVVLPLAAAWACGTSTNEPGDVGTDSVDASTLDAATTTDAMPTDARPDREPRPDEPQAWSTRRCDAQTPRDAQTWVEHSEGGACALQNTCSPLGYIQPGAVCDDLDVCFDAPYQGELPGRFAACERYADAPACCRYEGHLNADPYHRRVVDTAAMDDICALTALGAHVHCMVWLN